MPVTEAEHLSRLDRLREYRDTSPLPEDERIHLPCPITHYPDARTADLYVATCPRCSSDVASTVPDALCRCGCAFTMEWK